MRTHSLTILTAATLLSTSALSTEAFAQKGISLQPQSSWAIKNVNAGDNNGYCAMARRFNEGLILTIAKNNSGETSLALDFSNGTFDQTQSYPVVLDAGAGQQRNMSTKPISSKAFVLKIGNDAKFFSALEKTGYLRIELNENNYNFNLADIDSGRQKLDACLVTSISPASGNDDAGMVPLPESGRANSDMLEQEKNKLSARLFSLEAENEKLRLSLAQVSQKPATTQPVAMDPVQNSLLKKEIETLRAEKLRLENLMSLANADIKQKTNISIVKLSQENQRLQALLDQKATTDVDAEEMKQLRQRLAKLEDENLKLTESLNSQSASASVSDDLKSEISALKSMNQKLQAQVDSQDYSSADIIAFKNDIENLEQNNEALSARVASLMREKDEAFAQISFYETENDTLKGKVSSLTSSPAISSDKALLDQLRSEIGTIERRNAETLAQKDSEISMLDTQVQTLNQKLSALEANETGQAEKYKAQLDALAIKNEVLKNEMVSLSKDKASIDQIRTDLKLAIQEKEKIKQDYEFIKNRAATLEAEALADQDFVRELEAKKSDISALEKNILKLESQNADLRVSLEEAAKKESSNALIQAQVDSLKAENENLKQKIASADSNEQAMEKKLKDLVSDNKLLNEKLASSEGLVSQVDKLKNDLVKLENENAKLHQNLALKDEKSQGALADVDHKIDLLTKENLALQSSLNAEKSSRQGIQSSLSDSLKSAEQTIIDLELKLATLEESHKNAKIAAETASNFNKILQSNMIGLEQNVQKITEIDNDKSQAKLKQVEAQLLEVAAEFDVLKSEKLALIEKLDTVENDKVVLVSELEARSDTEISEHKDALQEEQAKVENLTRLNESLEMEMAALKNAQAETAQIASVVSGEADQKISGENKQNDISEVISSEGAEDFSAVPVPSVKPKPIIPERARDIAERAERPVAVMSEAPAPATPLEPKKAISKMDNQSANALALLEPAAGEQTDLPKVLEVSPVPAPEELNGDLAGLSEAQRLERSLKRDLLNKAPPEVMAVKPEIKQQLKTSKPQEFSGAVEPPVSEKPKTVANTISSSDDISSLLQKANIEIKQNVSPVENNGGAAGRAYQWKSTQNLFGSAYITPSKGDEDFDKNVQAYLERTESRCTADFAIVPTSSIGSGSTRIDSYEIACIGNGVDSSAAVAFFVRDGNFTAMAHEAPSSDMASIIEVRDRIVDEIYKS